MISYLMPFLGHGGFKLLIFGFYLVARIFKSNAEKNRKQNATLRGNTGIRDFSSPDMKTGASTPGAAEMSASNSPFASAPDAAKPAAPLTLKTSLTKSGEMPVFRPKPDANATPRSTRNAPDSPWSSNQNPFN